MTLTENDTVLFSLTAGINPGPNRRKGDFMATVWVTKSAVPGEKGALRCEYRFRWWNTLDKVDMDGAPDDDEKSFFGIGPVPDTAENRQKLKDALRNMTAVLPGFHGIHEQEGEWASTQFIFEVMDKAPFRTQITRGEKP